MHAKQTFSYDGLTLRVGCTDPAALQWLGEVLSPPFAALEGGPTDCSVELEVDKGRYAQVHDLGPHPDGVRLACFVFDSGLVHLPLWTAPGADRVIFDADAEVFYFVSPTGVHVRILSASAHPSRRIALMRVVREFAMSAAWSRTRCVLHAAACEVGGNGIIIAGPKGAGKTTLLMYALGCPGARLIANDRVVVDHGGSPPVVHGMPTIVSIRARTLDRFPAFTQPWAQHRFNERMALGEAPAGALASQRPEPLNLTPAQFRELLAVPPAAGAPARVLLYPQFNDAIAGARLQEISTAVGRQRLASNIFAASSHRKISEVFALRSRGAPPEPLLDHRMSWIDDLRCFECQLGRPAEHSFSDVTDFLGRVLR